MNYDKRTIRTWSLIGSTGIFGVAMELLKKEYDDIQVITADLCQFSGLERYRKEYPDDYYNVGIAEQNLVGVAAGLASENMSVYASTYATFCTTRALDQVKISMGYMQLPIKLIGLTAGYSSGVLGATHMALEDIAVMKSIPNITILSPADCTETVKCLEAVAKYKKPVYIRLTGGSRAPVVYSEDYEYTIGVNNVLLSGKDICIIATGSMVWVALQVAEMLKDDQISVTIIDMHTIKPFEERIMDIAKEHSLIVTIEEHNIIGGIGDSIASEMASCNNISLLKLGSKDCYLHAAPYESLLEQSGLSKENIYKTIKEKYKEILDYYG